MTPRPRPTIDHQTAPSGGAFGLTFPQTMVVLAASVVLVIATMLPAPVWLTYLVIPLVVIAVAAAGTRVLHRRPARPAVGVDASDDAVRGGGVR